MNRIIFILIIVASLKVSAQTITNEYETITVTNWVKPGPYLRVLNGVTYNIAYSKQWNTFANQEGLGISMLDMNDSGESSHLVGSVQRVVGNATFYEIIREHYARETYTGTPYKTGSETERVVVVLNCPDATAKGLGFYCMKTTNYLNSQGFVFPCYDCGFQATNLVPEIKKMKVKKPI